LKWVVGGRLIIVVLIVIGTIVERVGILGRVAITHRLLINLI